MGAKHIQDAGEQIKKEFMKLVENLVQVESITIETGNTERFESGFSCVTVKFWVRRPLKKERKR